MRDDELVTTGRQKKAERQTAKHTRNLLGKCGVAWRSSKRTSNGQEYLNVLIGERGNEKQFYLFPNTYKRANIAEDVHLPDYNVVALFKD